MEETISIELWTSKRDILPHWRETKSLTGSCKTNSIMIDVTKAAYTGRNWQFQLI